MVSGAPSKKLSLLQLLTTLCLIFSMGVMLGSREGFIEEITTLGWESFLFFLLPTVGSVLVVYPLTRIFMKEHIKKRRSNRWSFLPYFPYYWASAMG